MVIKNAVVLSDDFTLEKADVEVSQGKIKQILPPDTSSDLDVLDAHGSYLLPGFVDIHTHGCMNNDFCDAQKPGLHKMLEYYAKVGVTSAIATTMSYDEEKLTDIIRTLKPYFGSDEHGCVLRGINMEGPFISVEKCGAQNPQYIMPPDIAMFERLQAEADGQIRMVDIAPEVVGGLEFTRKISKNCVVSLAHTNANYAQAAAAFQAGANHVTHMFNAMPAFLHRDPGVIGAAADSGAFAELITDGVHLHQSVVRAVFRLFGPEKICLVSDSMRGTGMPDGIYDLGGQQVRLQAGRANLVVGGAIAASACNLPDCCRRAISFGIPLEAAVRSATLTPAVSVGIDSFVGSITPGKRADFVLWDAADFSTNAVISAGKTLINNLQ